MDSVSNTVKKISVPFLSVRNPEAKARKMGEERQNVWIQLRHATTDIAVRRIADFCKESSIYTLHDYNFISRVYRCACHYLLKLQLRNHCLEIKVGTIVIAGSQFVQSSASPRSLPLTPARPNHCMQIQRSPLIIENDFKKQLFLCTMVLLWSKQIPFPHLSIIGQV